MSRILIVDDNEDNLYYLQALLGAGGHEVKPAKNGGEALSLALAETPDLIVSDILMPVMDGFSLCRQWRQESALSRIPFLFYTATYTDPKDKEFGLSIGADEFLVKPLEPDTLMAAIQKLLDQKQTGIPATESVIAPESEVFLREYNATLIRKLEDKLVQLETANKKIATTEEFVRTILDHSPLPIIAADREGRICLANKSFEEVFGFTFAEVQGRLCADSIVPSDCETEARLFALHARDGGAWSHATRRQRKDGAVLEVEVFLGSMKGKDTESGFIAIYRDVTEKRKLEEQLRQAQKLEAVGQFATGIAHDFNNLLGVMLGYSEFICNSVKSQSEICDYADQIQQACKRAAALTRQLLVFSRRQILAPEVMDLESNLEAMGSMLRRLIREDIELVWKVERPLGRVRMDPVQLEQIVLNLVGNASDAMPRGGKLVLEMSNARSDDEPSPTVTSMVTKEYVKLSVSDTGTGIDPATLLRIFEPFFTTKPKGMGTGLGLASVRNIVEQMGGLIRASSVVGSGSRFDVYFPRVQEEIASPVEPLKLSLCEGAETILLAEDERAIRALVAEMLSRLGYRVLCAPSAREAAKIIQESTERIDLLITDIVMPEMSGRDLADTVWGYRPEIEVLYVSGYEQELPPERGDSSRQQNFLAKPFTHLQLASTIRKILDSRTYRSLRKSG